MAKGAATPTRAIIFEMLERAYQNLGREIEATPLPEGLDEASLASVKENLGKMAAPFLKENANYQQLKQEQLAKMDPGKAFELAVMLSSTEEEFHELVPKESFASRKIARDFPVNEYKEKLSGLSTNPTDINLLQSVHNFLVTNNRERMAAYFTGRINSLNMEEGEKL